jgi:hypothetical protein
MIYSIQYPSGRTFNLSGDFELAPPMPNSRLKTPTISDGNAVAVIDPRAVIYDDSGHIVYSGCTTKELEDDLKVRRRTR